MKYIGLVPAYGRDYNSKAKVLLDIKEGRDFKISDYGSSFGQNANIESFKDQAPIALKIRYKRLTMVTVIVLNADGSAGFQK